MSNFVTSGLGDSTSHDVKPDFESGKAYYWMKAVKASRAAGVELPRHEKPGLAWGSFRRQVNERLSRQNFTVGIAFDKDGKIINESV